jgi:hypothetical protein
MLPNLKYERWTREMSLKVTQGSDLRDTEADPAGDAVKGRFVDPWFKEFDGMFKSIRTKYDPVGVKTYVPKNERIAYRDSINIETEGLVGNE